MCPSLSNIFEEKKVYYISDDGNYVEYFCWRLQNQIYEIFSLLMGIMSSKMSAIEFWKTYEITNICFFYWAILISASEQDL